MAVLGISATIYSFGRRNHRLVVGLAPTESSGTSKREY